MSLAVSQAIGDTSGMLPRMATGFGGGMAGAGGTCGALVGAIMAVGLLHGRSRPEDDRRPAYGLTTEIVDAFEKEMGSTRCRDLTGLDLRTREGMTALREDVGGRVCARAIELGERLAVERLVS